MFPYVRPPARTFALIAVLAAALPALARGASSPPTQDQIRAAVKKAEHSKNLWATVNVCKRPNFGIRGQMPALSFPAKLSMRIQVAYYDRTTKTFKPLHGTVTIVKLGTRTDNLYQGGTSWTFRHHAFVAGIITFKWRMGNRLIGEVTRTTLGGIKGVDDSNPPGHSSASCRFR